MPVSHPLLTGVVDEPTLARLFDRAKGVKWGLAPDAFARALGHTVACRFAQTGAHVGEIESYVQSLHLEDLALACACAEGQVTAWVYFLECFRPAIRTAARAIAADDDTGARLADSLCAELYDRHERSRSVLTHFNGRSRLATWLRAVLAQRHVDRMRQARRMENRSNPSVAPEQCEAARPSETCPEVELLAASFDHSLSSDPGDNGSREAAAVEAHLAGCGRCREVVACLARSEPQILYVRPVRASHSFFWPLRRR